MPEPAAIPYPFILEYLTGNNVVIQPMFGGYAVYSDAKLCLFLVRRDRPVLLRDAGKEQNGVYVATTAENVHGLTPMFEGADVQHLKDGKAWIFIAESGQNFESYSIKACELIAKLDARIGR